MPFSARVRFSLGALLFFGRADYESALGSPASEPDSQSGGFYNACPNFETHPAPTQPLDRKTSVCYSYQHNSIAETGCEPEEYASERDSER